MAAGPATSQPDDSNSNFITLRECLSGIIIQGLLGQSTKQSTKSKKGHKSQSVVRDRHAVETEASDGAAIEELSEFIDFLATEIYESFPDELRSLDYTAVAEDPKLGNKYSDENLPKAVDEIISGIPASVTDSLSAYGVLKIDDVNTVLAKPVTSYVTAVLTAPPKASTTQRASACEICERDWILLTYHHLIPRGVHAKVVKRGWHPKENLNDVAWLCRACHSMVHGIANNEELARNFYTVDLLVAREDVQRWATWVGKVRWKSR